MSTPSFQVLKTEYLSGQSLRDLAYKYSVDKSTVKWKLDYYGFTDYRKSLTDKQRENVRRQSLGRTHTKETKEKLRLCKLGNKNPNWNGGMPEFVCINCNKTFKTPLCNRGVVKYCSNKCAHEDMVVWNKGMFGPKNHMWKEEKRNALTDSIRQLFIYKNWRKSVFERDNYTCSVCKNRGCYLEAHHKTPFAYILYKNNIKTPTQAIFCEDLWSTNNGLTVCRDCHVAIDPFIGKNLETIKNNI